MVQSFSVAMVLYSRLSSAKSRMIKVVYVSVEMIDIDHNFYLGTGQAVESLPRLCDFGVGT